ncbi:DUF2256 domain-containing protein [Sphingobium sp. PAMC28499]|nr:DUF2256 domain-containing protein [Sphingobium sp. PAMC28499]
MTHHKLKRLLKIGIGRGRRFIWRRRWTRDWEQVKFVPALPQARRHWQLRR